MNSPVLRSPFDPFQSEPPEGIPWGINFGGGDNSRALLLFCHDRGLRPDWVVFSDTGSEWPETYEALPLVEEWCKSVGFPFAVTRWTRVRGAMAGQFESVHENALRTNYLPSKAYGYSGCTFKWKIQPLQRWRKENGFVPSGVAIGYDAGEKARLAKARKRACQDIEQATDEVVWYPLVAWGYDRAACTARLREQGWTSHKSACFCCPNNKTHEWERLSRDHPELYQQSVLIEIGAKNAGNADKVSLFRNPPGDASCVCTADGCLISEDDTPDAQGVAEHDED